MQPDNKHLEMQQILESKLKQIQEEMALTMVTGEAGAGLTKVESNCRGDIKKISIDSSLLNPESKTILEDLIIAAIQNAQKKAEEQSKASLINLARSLNIPDNSFIA